MTKPRLLLFPASLRQRSHQRRLVDYMAAHIGDQAEIDLLDSVDLPLFNQDIENSTEVLGVVKALHERISLAEGMIIASPEYNGHVSPYLKNTVDWVSRLARIDAGYAAINPFRDKPLLLASASTGWTGGALGLKDARSIFTYLGNLVVSDQLCVSDAEQWIVGETYQFEPAFAAHIERILRDFLNLVHRLRQVKSV